MADAWNLARTLGDWLLELLAPQSCAACAAQSRALFCANCDKPTPAPPELLGGTPLIAAGLYRTPLKEAVASYKFGGRPELAAPFSQLLEPELRALALAPGDVFAPVPLHRARLAERGYDQAALLAGALARRTGLRYMPRLLERRRETSQQASLDRQARLENVSDAFRVRQACGSGRVVLVDDVVTTGSTVLACFGALAGAGIPVRAIVAIARANGPANN